MHLADPIEIKASLADGPCPVIVWMPKGKHTISASKVGGGDFGGEIICDKEGFDAIKASFDEFKSQGYRIWIDANHDDGAALAWVKDFAWSDSLGIVAHLEWTPRGEEVLRNKEFYSFSPTFRCNRHTGKLTSLVEGHAAGGLVNAPAFGSAMPALVAAKLSDVTASKYCRLILEAKIEQLPGIMEVITDCIASVKSLEEGHPGIETHLEFLDQAIFAVENNPNFKVLCEEYQ